MFELRARKRRKSVSVRKSVSDEEAGGVEASGTKGREVTRGRGAVRAVWPDHAGILDLSVAPPAPPSCHPPGR